MSNFLQRLITAILGVGIIVFATVYQSWSFAIVFGLIMLLSLREFYGLAKGSGSHPFEVWGIGFGVVMFCLAYLVLAGLLEARYLWVLPPLLLFCFLFPLYRLETVHPINCLAITLLGIIYIAVPFTLLLAIGFSGKNYDFSLILGLLLAQWANDTGAYFAGKALGRTKLFEKVSPNKTWEGTIGGAVLALICLYIWSTFFDHFSVIQWLGLSLVTVIFGSFGDLVESLFKRTLSIKDSGNLIPGHGGFLDRFDGLILALPFAAAYVMLVM